MSLKAYFVLLFTIILLDVKAQNSDKKEPGFWELIFGDVFDEPHHKVPNKFEDKYRVIDLEKQWKFHIGNNEEWKETAFDDQSWVNIQVPGDWENDGFHGYDGFAWYRISFDGRNLKPQEAHYLNLGFIDDVDETYLNGALVGKTGSFPPRFRTAYNSYRDYYIGNDLINFNGKNVIAVKVYDDYQIGGIVKGEPGIYVSGGSEKLLQNLYGSWKFNKSNSRSFVSPEYDDSNWDIVLVPSYWDNQGYRSLDGIGWYRKTFKMSFEIDSNQTYYLVLGRIDDFDETFLNGEKIGETDDGRGFGESRSYVTMRIYKIPKNLLKEKANNTIAIKVKDIGLEGGIYSGPIGIVSEDDITELVRQKK